MARLGLIREHELEAFILERAAKGMHTRQIAAAIAAERGVEIDFTTVSRWLKGIRQARAALNRKVIENHLQAGLHDDLASLEAMTDQLAAWFFDTKLKVSEKLAIGRELRRTLELRLRLAGAVGAHVPTDVDFAAMTDTELEGFIQKLATEQPSNELDDAVEY